VSPASPGGLEQELAPALDALCASREELLRTRKRSSGRHPVPSRHALRAILSDLRAALFPDHFGTKDSELSDAGIREFVQRTLRSALAGLRDEIRCGLWFTCDHGDPDSCRDCDRRAGEITQAFAARLPALRAMLGGDAQAAYDGDPAAASLDEVVICYPGFTAITHHRIAHELHSLGVPLVPRIIAALAHANTAVDIHPAAEIGGHFFIDHGTGVVIGETCRIGDRVRLYQGVTLGAKSFSLDERGHPRKGVPRHPIVEDDVTIYAGATILGRITVGKGSTIGGNVWVTRSVPAHSRITQALARQEVWEEGAGI
jgi:serine O-acetyltransferase